MNRYATTPAQIAAALRRAADDIEAMGDVTLSQVFVALNMQAVMHGGSASERTATVDALCLALLGVPGVQPDGDSQYHEPTGADDSRGDLRVDVYTGFRAGESRD